MSGLVSVIIPNYNHERYIKQRIESVLNQTYDNIEVIILDDCSADSSLDIINSYRKSPDVRQIMINSENSGSTFKQWGKGLSVARGEWLWIAESDDYCETDFLETLLSDQISDQCGLRFCASYPADNGGVLTIKKTPSIPNGEYDGLDFIKKYQTSRNHIPNASGVLMKKELLIKALTTEITGYKLLGDHLAYINMMLTTRVYFCDEVKNFHRNHTNNVRSRSNLDGTWHKERYMLRDYLDRLFSGLEKADLRKELLEINRMCSFTEEGFWAMDLARSKKYMKCIRPLLRATFNPKFNLYYLRSLLYWLLRPLD